MTAHQALPSLGFSRQEHWSGLPMKSESEVAQSCPTLHNSVDCSLPGSYIHGIFQARVLEWGAIAFSKALDISYCLHCAWRPQSSGKVERANQFLKSVIKKITQVSSPGMEGGFTISSPPYQYLEKAMATHSSILAWEILWTEEPGGLQYIGLQRVGHN